MKAGDLAITMVAQTARMAVPYVCAGLGGVWSERSGIANIALEGVLLAGGLGAVVAHLATGNAWAGAGAGVAVGAIVGAAHALLVDRGKVDAIVSGLALNLVAAGGTRVVLRALYGSSSNSPAVEGFRWALGAGSLVQTLADPLWWTAGTLVAWSVWAIGRTRFGLQVRACGEDPVAAASVGVNVPAVRLAAVVTGCAICALGGVALAYDQHQFQSGMSGGRGFIALAAVVLAGWRPGRATAACVAFAALDAMQIVAQGEARSGGGLLEAVPYGATLVALWAIARARTRARALG